MRQHIRPFGRYASHPQGRRLARIAAAVTSMSLLAGCATAITGAPIRGAAPSSGTPTPADSAPQWPAMPELPSATDAAELGTAPAGSGETSATQGQSPAEPAGVADADVGLLPDAPDSGLTITGGTDGDVDAIAAASLADLFTYYTEIFPDAFGLDFVVPGSLISYDSTQEGEVCGLATLHFVNAFFAPLCDAVAWDRGIMLADMHRDIGDLAPAVILSHEIGHAVQYQLGQWDSISAITAEQQADCYAGGFWRWVEDGNSEYFAFNQGEGIRQLLLTVLSVKDPPMMREEAGGDDDAHGNGFDRTYAATLGYSAGPLRCSHIDDREISARGQQFPFDDIPYQYGNVDITTDNIAGILQAVDMYFNATQPGYTPPTLAMYAGHVPPTCAGQPTTFPVAYCPGSNTVSYQLAELKRLGRPAAGWASANGDFSVFVLLVSRYALAAQYAGHAPITGTRAGLLALCYAGTWANWMRTPHNDYQLSPNDLDKAIYQIISSPLASSDVNGATDASIVERVQAFGFGVTTTITSCFDTYAG